MMELNYDLKEVELIDPSVWQLIEPDPLKMIELAGRTCYKSEDKITDTSALEFVKKICAKNHTAMLEHATIYLTAPAFSADPKYHTIADIKNSKFSEVVYDDDNMYITTNFRVIYENCYYHFDTAWNFVRNNSVEPTKHVRRHSFRIICDRGVSHELVRHRVFSFAHESTRYVNYKKRKYQFIKPSWWDMVSERAPEGQLSLEQHLFLNSCRYAATTYDSLLELNQTPQQARAVLSHSLKTEIVMTGTETQWKAFLQLRTAPNAHPDMQVIAGEIKDLLHTINPSLF